jgi:hypothetical protein
MADLFQAGSEPLSFIAKDFWEISDFRPPYRMASCSDAFVQETCTSDPSWSTWVLRNIHNQEQSPNHYRAFC